MNTVFLTRAFANSDSPELNGPDNAGINGVPQKWVLSHLTKRTGFGA